MEYLLSEIWVILKWVLPYLATFIGLLILIEQITYLKKKSNLTGPLMVFPFLGNVSSLVRDPAKFWDVQGDYAKSSPLGISANYIIDKFMLFIRDSEMSHKIFANVRPDAFQLIGHPFGKKLFGEHDMIYLYGQEHKDLRRQIAPHSRKLHFQKMSFCGLLPVNTHLGVVISRRDSKSDFWKWKWYWKFSNL